MRMLQVRPNHVQGTLRSRERSRSPSSSVYIQFNGRSDIESPVCPPFGWHGRFFSRRTRHDRNSRPGPVSHMLSRVSLSLSRSQRAALPSPRSSTSRPSRSRRARRSTCRFRGRRDAQRREVEAAVKYTGGQARSRSPSRRWSPRSCSAATSRRTSCGPSRATAPSRTSASSSSPRATPRARTSPDRQEGVRPHDHGRAVLPRRPAGEYVIATSGSADPRRPRAPVRVQRFRTGVVKADMNTIAGLTYKDKKPVSLVQAERAVALAERTARPPSTRRRWRKPSARSRRPRTRRRAAARRPSRTSRAAPWPSRPRRCATRPQAEADEAAKKAALESQMTVAQLPRRRPSSRRDQAKLLADQEQLKKEKAELEGASGKSMSSVMETRESARGAVMSLPGISFETGKAVLKQSAQITLAKLAGIAQVFPNINIRVEGYTDDAGAPRRTRSSPRRAPRPSTTSSRRRASRRPSRVPGLGPRTRSRTTRRPTAGQEPPRRDRRRPGEIKPVDAN